MNDPREPAGDDATDDGRPAAPGDSDNEADEEDQTEAGALGDEQAMEEWRAFARAAKDSLDKLGTGNVIMMFGRDFTGNQIAGGDIGAGGAFALGWEWTQHRRDTLTRTQVLPSGYYELDQILADRSLLVLKARSAWGGTSLAARLLTDGADRLFHVSGLSGPVKSIHADEIELGSGLVIEGLTSTQLADLGAGGADQFAAILRSRRSRAVIVVDEHQGLSEARFAGMAARLAVHPRPIEVVERHLAEHVGDPRRARELTEREDIAAAAGAIRDDRFDVHMLVALARELAKVDQGSADVAEVLGSFSHWSQSDLEKWLDDSVNDDRRLSRILAQAAFDGFPQRAIQQAADSLMSHLEGGATPPPRAPRVKQSQEARELRTRTSVEESSDGGRTVTMSFADDTYAARILELVIDQYDLLDQLLLWLRALADTAESATAIRAASVIGYLGQRYARDECVTTIREWAAGKGPLKGHLAVVALRMMAAHPDSFAAATRLVERWTRNNSPALRRTAAKALGVGIGVVIGSGTDAALARLAKSADRPLAVLVGASMAELFAASGPERRVVLVETLRAWTDEPPAGRQLAGIAGFLWSSRIRVATSFNGSDVQWPLLLLLSSVDSGFRRDDTTGPWDHAAAERIQEAAAWMLATAAGSPELQRETTATVRGWGRDCGQHPGLRHELESWFDTAARLRPRQRRNLYYYRALLPGLAPMQREDLRA